MTVSFEELEVGATWRSTGRTLTEAELTLACMTSGDWHSIHADAEFSKTLPGGQRMFHGTYCLHVAFAMAVQYPDLGNAAIGVLGFTDWKFRAPVYPGDTVHVEVTIQGKRATSDGKRGVFERQIKLINQAGAVVQEGSAATMVSLKGAAS